MRRDYTDEVLKEWIKDMERRVDNLLSVVKWIILGTAIGLIVLMFT